MQKIFYCVAIALVVISCHTSKHTNITPAAPIVNKDFGKELSGNWQLQKLWASDSKWPKNPIIIFDYEQKTFTGNNGCNSISGKFKSSGSFIAFDKQMISTRMACLNYNEGTFNNALLKINKFTIKDGELELSQDEIVLLSFKKQ